ncbi:MAG: CoA transferase [Marinosulfonomonas sp.]|nr:CoA transferase [Marinosulfonomonas sp.]
MAQERSLAGVKVIERVGRLAGTVCAGRLEDLGAEIIRVSVVGDPLANEPAEWRDHPFTATNGAQIQLDSTSADFADQWQALVSTATVVIVTPAIGADGIAQADATFQGLDTNRLIVCAMSPFGLETTDPPIVDPGEVEMQAISGLLATTGDTTGKPAIVDLPILEVFTGLNAATAVVAALRVKEASGLGQLLDMAVFETCFSLTGTFLGKVLSGKTRGFRNGCRHPLVSPWNAYQTSDGCVILCTTSNGNWLDLTTIMGRPELANDPEFALAASRIANVEKVDQLVGRWARSETTDDALAKLRERGIPCGVVAQTRSIAKAGKPIPCRRSRALGAVTSEVPKTQSTRSDPPAMPLAGIKVLELGPYTAGPLAGRFLGNLGADIVKIEGPGGEDSRLWQPLVDGVSCYFANYNAGKKSVVLDLRSEQGKATFLDLVKTSDVLLFNLKAGALDRMGLGADELLKINPCLIYCGISGYGFSGSDRPALDTVIQAEAGVIARIASDTGPIKGGFSFADLAAAHMAPLEIIAALRQVQKTGTGVILDIAMYDTVAWMGELSWPGDDPVLPPNTIVQASDGWVVAMGEAADMDVTWAKSQRGDVVVERLAAADVRATKILELDEVYDLSVAKRSGLLVHEHENRGGNAIISAPYAFSRTPTLKPCIVPETGADNLLLTGHRAVEPN